MMYVWNLKPKQQTGLGNCGNFTTCLPVDDCLRSISNIGAVKTILIIIIITFLKLIFAIEQYPARSCVCACVEGGACISID